MTTIDITIPEGARAVLVYPGSNGELLQKPVARNASVMNLKADLIAHLSDQPFSDGWLEELRDYVDARLEARLVARATGGLSIAGSRRWQVLVDPRLQTNSKGTS
ncbi:hypothetical protein D7I39_10040 [Allopusillimonas ginsengisoli]|nr:hypothetical protein D7I39_10040 [Allopusillimonas ginsengisoli]